MSADVVGQCPCFQSDFVGVGQKNRHRTYLNNVDVPDCLVSVKPNHQCKKIGQCDHGFCKDEIMNILSEESVARQRSTIRIESKDGLPLPPPN